MWSFLSECELPPTKTTRNVEDGQDSNSSFYCLKHSDFHIKMSVLLLMIKISQLALESLDSFCKKTPSRAFLMN